MIDLLGFKIILAFSLLTFKDLKIKISLEKAVKEEILSSQLSYKLKSTIYGSVA